MGVFDKASLALVPDGIKDGKLYSIKPTDGSGDFTFERGSNLAATRVDENGLIEKGRENLLINSVWDGVSTDTKPTNWSTQFLLGTGTFDVTSIEEQIRFTTSDSSSRSFIYTPNITINGILTLSIYVDVVYTQCQVNQILGRSGSATAIAYYEDGIAVNSNHNVQAGKRYSIVFNKTGTTTFRFGVGISSGTLGDIVLSRPQLEQGLVATDYIETGATTPQAGILEDLPRIDYTGGTPSLLMEPSRTNLIDHSEYLKGNSEFKVLSSSTTLDSYTETSPDGNANALKILETAITGSHSAYYDSLSGFTNGVTYTFSFFAKSIGGRNVRFADATVGMDMEGIIDLSDGSILQDVYNNISVESYGNGWYRIIASGTMNGTNQRIIFTTIDGTTQSFPGDTTKGVSLWGVQIEQGSYPTSYIPTYGAIATRGMDTSNNTSVGSTGNYFSVFMDYSDYNNGGINGDNSIVFKDSSNNTIFALWGLNNGFTIRSFSGDTGGNYYTNNQFGRTVKAIIRYDGSEIALFIDGIKQTLTLSSSETNWNQIAKVDLLQASDNKYRMNQFIIFPEALSDAECITLTT